MMKISDRVRVKDATRVSSVHRGRTGTIIADPVLGEPVEVEFDDETVPYSFHLADLETI